METTADTNDLDNLLNSNKDLSSILDNLLDDYAKDVSDIYLTLFNIKEANTKWSEVAFTTLGILPLPLPLPPPLLLPPLLPYQYTNFFNIITNTTTTSTLSRNNLG